MLRSQKVSGNDLENLPVGSLLHRTVHKDFPVQKTAIEKKRLSLNGVCVCVLKPRVVVK